jgi:hypothetical protein
MPTYDVRCEGGHRSEIRIAIDAMLPPCPVCGAATAKVPTGFAIGGRATLPPAPEAMPQTWRGTYRGDREYLASLQRTAEQRRVLEERHPEIAGDRRPVVAHEGRYEQAPLRSGDPAPSTDSPP